MPDTEELKRVVEGRDGIVITSYSIHYTKLYDVTGLQAAPPWSARTGRAWIVRGAALAQRPTEILDQVVDGFDPHRHPDQAVGQPQPGPLRITSYNVCYTKLLRSLTGSWKRRLPPGSVRRCRHQCRPGWSFSA